MNELDKWAADKCGIDYWLDDGLLRWNYNGIPCQFYTIRPTLYAGV